MKVPSTTPHYQPHPHTRKLWKTAAPHLSLCMGGCCTSAQVWVLALSIKMCLHIHTTISVSSVARTIKINYPCTYTPQTTLTDIFSWLCEKLRAISFLTLSFLCWCVTLSVNIFTCVLISTIVVLILYKFWRTRLKLCYNYFTPFKKYYIWFCNLHVWKYQQISLENFPL